MTGQTTSLNFPALNAIQPSLAGTSDAFVTKINAAGSALVYSTYLGGGSTETGIGIAVDAPGNAYVTGQTQSTNFPTVNAIQPSLGGGSDAFVTKINAAGTALVYSTYLGGNDYDYGEGIAVDASGNAYVTGQTVSTNFPIVNAIQPANGGNNDAFVTKISTAGSALVYSTYLGGSNADSGIGIAVDASGNAYVTGQTTSPNFPTVNALQPAIGGSYDAFVTKIDAAGSALVYSTYLGGSSDDLSIGIAVDASRNAYVSGYTLSPNFPTSRSLQTFNLGNNSSNYDAFLSKINSAGNALVYSTYFGGSSVDVGHGVAVDSQGNAYTTGYTSSSDLPTANPFQSAYAGNSDAFIAKISDSQVVLNPSGLAFGAEGVHKLSAPQRVVLTNLAGGSALTIHSIVTSSSTSWPATSNCPVSPNTLASGQSCTITVRFNPPAAGARTGTITITDSDSNSPQTVALTGTGVVSNVTLSSTLLRFSKQLAGTTSAFKGVTFANGNSTALLGQFCS